MDDERSRISTADAADRLGMSARRVRALAAAGALPAERIGGIWLLDRRAVERRSLRRSAQGRPLSARSAWALLATLEGNEPAGISRSEVVRARERARRAESLAPGELAARARVLQLRAHPGVLDRLAEDRRLVAAGVSAARVHRADLVAVGELDAYVRPEDGAVLIDEFALRPATQPNVTLRIPQGPWPFAENARVAPAAVCAADLLDNGDERSMRAARSLLADLVKHVPARGQAKTPHGRRPAPLSPHDQRR